MSRIQLIEEKPIIECKNEVLAKYNFSHDVNDFKSLAYIWHDTFSRVARGSPYKLTKSLVGQITNVERTLPNVNLHEQLHEQLSFYRLIYIFLKRASDYSVERGNDDVMIEINFGDELTKCSFKEWNENFIISSLEKIKRRITSLVSLIFANALLHAKNNNLDGSDVIKLEPLIEFIDNININVVIRRIIRKVKSFKMLQTECGYIGGLSRFYNEELINSFYELIKLADFEM